MYITHILSPSLPPPPPPSPPSLSLSLALSLSLSDVGLLCRLMYVYTNTVHKHPYGVSVN